MLPDQQLDHEDEPPAAPAGGLVGSPSKRCQAFRRDALHTLDAAVLAMRAGQFQRALTLTATAFDCLDTAAWLERTMVVR